MTDKAVATEILRQLGGNVFIRMTGAKDFGTNGDNLTMTLPRNNSGANRLEITLDYATDTYNMRFFKYSKARISLNTGAFSPVKIKEIRSFSEVYCDQLQDIFTDVTGFDTHMPRIIGFNC